MKYFTALCCGVALLLPPAALADDSAAALGAGGLVLQKTDKVVLVSEELYLSATAVRISYRFRNVSDADYTTVVAFPMPDLPGGVESDDGDDTGDVASPPDPASDNFMQFQTLVDGQPVASRLEQRAFLKGEGKSVIEITDKLKALHIPLVPTEEATNGAVARLTVAQRKALVEAGVFGWGGGSVGDYAGQTDGLYPLWGLRSKYWRTQIFPKGKEITVQQSYTPATGGNVESGLGMEGDELKYYRDTYCTDDDFLSSAGALVKRMNDDRDKGARTVNLVQEQWLQYIITSGGNWAGPIGDFRLIVDKGDTRSLVSFCGEGVKKVSPTQFMLEIRNYTPKRDIDVLFLRVRPVTQ